jgi:hypothetical protein
MFWWDYLRQGINAKGLSGVCGTPQSSRLLFPVKNVSTMFNIKVF